MVEANLVLTAGIFLTALALGGLLALRLGQSVIPAYILVGVLLGPYAPSVGGVSLTVVESTEIVRLLADLGVVLLLFFVVWLGTDPRVVVSVAGLVAAAATVTVAGQIVSGYAAGRSWGLSVERRRGWAPRWCPAGSSRW